jgi:hypothetical protein
MVRFGFTVRSGLMVLSGFMVPDGFIARFGFISPAPIATGDHEGEPFYEGGRGPVYAELSRSRS